MLDLDYANSSNSLLLDANRYCGIAAFLSIACNDSVIWREKGVWAVGLFKLFDANGKVTGEMKEGIEIEIERRESGSNQ